MPKRCLIIIILLFVGDNLLAGGFEYPDNGVVAIGRGGAFTAKADDLSAMYYNPAGLIKSKGYLTLFYSHNFTLLSAEFERKAWDFSNNAYADFAKMNIENPVSNQFGWFNRGAMFGVASDFGTQRFVGGFGLFGPSAIGSQRFPINGSQRYMMVEKDILLMYYSLIGAYRITENLAVGAVVQWADMPRCRFSIVVDGYNGSVYRPFQSNQDVLATLDVKDRFAMTAILGLWYKPHPSVELGLAGRIIPIWMKARGDISLKMLGDWVLPPEDMGDQPNYWMMKCPNDDHNQCKSGYSGASLSFVLPPNIRFGARYIHRVKDYELFDVEMDFFYEFWSMLKEFEIDPDADHLKIVLRDGSTNIRELRNLSIPKRFKDSFSIRVGGDFNAIPKYLTVRAGMFYESPAVRKAYTNVDFFPFHSIGLGGGFTFKYKGISLNAAYSHIFQPKWRVTEQEASVLQQRPTEECSNDDTFCDPNYKGMVAPPVNSGLYRTSYDIVSIGLTFDLETMVKK